MDAQVEGRRALRGTLSVPGDKSISHRAVMLGCLASGTSSLEALSSAQDVASTVRAFRRMGMNIENRAGVTEIHGVGIAGFRDRVPERLSEIDCENSGTTARLLIGLLSGAGKRVRLTGDASLLRRPMMRIVNPLNEHGASIETTGGRLPVTLGGKRLSPIRCTVPVPSAQVKSSLMLAALFIDGVSVIVEARQTRDHTERMMRHMGGCLEISSAERGAQLKITGLKELQPLHMTVPGDISSAVFFIAAALLTQGSSITVRNVLLNPTRSHILDVFGRMGARIETEMRQRYPEPVGDVHVQCSRLTGIDVGGDEIPLIIDEIPALAACALFARGDTVVRDAEELRLKESDRIDSIVNMIKAFGGDVDQRQDGFTVHGRGATDAAEVDSFGDHRIAMAASVIALASEGKSTVRNAQCVGVSFPDFFHALDRFSS
jgi:3-phosphoshikimate 1-carboxyvinyltransferase